MTNETGYCGLCDGLGGGRRDIISLSFCPPTQTLSKRNNFQLCHHTSISHHLTLLSLSLVIAGTTKICVLGAPTMAPTERIHHNLVILKLSSIRKKYKIWNKNLAHFHALHPVCNQECLQRCLPLLFHTHPFSQQFVFAQFSLIWTFYIKGSTFSLHITYGLSISSYFYWKFFRLAVVMGLAAKSP